jgi:hypothetical protein
MYNTSSVTKGGCTPNNTLAQVDLTGYLRTATAETRFINEGGDKMDGDLNMNNHFITNLPFPNSGGDAVSYKFMKQHLANMPIKLPNKYPQIDMNNNRIINLQEPKNDTDGTNKSYVDSSISRFKEELFNEDENVLDPSFKSKYIPINFIKQKVKEEQPIQFGFILRIGDHNGYYKTTFYRISFNSPTKLEYYQFNLQITPIMESLDHHDEIFCLINKYNVIDNELSFWVLSVRSTNNHWEINLYAHLLITIFSQNQPVLDIDKPYLNVSKIFPH